MLKIEYFNDKNNIRTREVFLAIKASILKRT